MIRYLLDTDSFSLYMRYDMPMFTSVIRHMPLGIGLPIIAVEEIWNGWQAVIRNSKSAVDAATAYQRLADTLIELKNWSIITPSPEALLTFKQLKKAKLNVGGNDLKIAAIAMSIGAILVTGNTRDFNRIAGLSIEDWSERARV